jgi:hypothetical protein
MCFFYILHVFFFFFFFFFFFRVPTHPKRPDFGFFRLLLAFYCLFVAFRPIGCGSGSGWVAVDAWGSQAWLWVLVLYIKLFVLLISTNAPMIMIEIQNPHFSDQNTLLSYQNTHTSYQNTYFSYPQTHTFPIQTHTFLSKSTLFFSKSVHFLSKNTLFLSKSVHFLSKSVHFLSKTPPKRRPGAFLFRVRRLLRRRRPALGAGRDPVRDRLGGGQRTVARGKGLQLGGTGAVSMNRT